MRLRRLRLNNFRNHLTSELLCAPRFNVLVGGNGQGKTSVLEAVAVCAWTRSFVPPPGNADSQLVRRGTTELTVAGEFDSDSGIHVLVATEYDDHEKRMAVDGQPLTSFARHIGAIPLVVLAPGDREVTFGGPAERRKMIDVLISQAKRGYIESMMDYRRALKQRNAVLYDVKRGTPGARQTLGAWTASMTGAAAMVFRYRAQFLTEFAAYLHDAHLRIATAQEEVGIIYQPNVSGTAENDIGSWTNAVAAAFEEKADEEMARGTTLVGPHRDEVLLTINGVEARLGASQGQHKTLLVALKLAEWTYLFDTLQERPLFLLDDLFSELDAARSERFVRALEECGQVFISTVEDGETMCVRKVFDTAQDAIFTVKAGSIAHG